MKTRRAVGASWTQASARDRVTWQHPARANFHATRAIVSSVATRIASRSPEARRAVDDTGTGVRSTSDTVGTLALVVASCAPTPGRTLLGAVGAHEAGLALAHAALGMAARCVLQLALARVAAVGTPGHRGARHVALGPEATWIALAEAEDPVAAHRGAHHGAATFALFAVITSRAAIFTELA